MKTRTENKMAHTQISELESLKGIVLDAVAELLRASGTAAVALRGATPDQAVLAGDVAALARLLDMQEAAVQIAPDDIAQLSALMSKDRKPLPHFWVVYDGERPMWFAFVKPEDEEWPGKKVVEYVTGVAPEVVSDAARDVLAERRRQVTELGRTTRGDDCYRDGELARAAACYAMGNGFLRGTWPWDQKWWKPRDMRSNLVRAGALILAEIERLDRAALSK
jgi:hypothetical protein